MRPVSMAWGGLLALVLTGAAAAAPLNPQPLPPGRHALAPQPSPGRRTQAAYLLTTACAEGRHARRTGGGQGSAPAGSHGSGGGGGGRAACRSGKP